MKKKMTFALCFCNRGFMPGELIYGARDDMVKAVTDAGYDYIMMDKELTRYGGVETRDEGLLYAKWLKEHEGQYDGVIFSMPIFADENGAITAVHHAGAGEMVTRIIDLELDLHDRDTAELIKKYPLAKVEGLLFLRFEDGSVKFVSEPLPPELFARVVIVAGDTLVPVRSSKRLSIDRIALVRREAKRKVFIANAERALRRVAPDGDLRQIGSVALVGGSSQDFEIADLLAEHLMAYRITTGRANLLGFLPPHSAVALGLALADDA